jgi:hypothetical protein
MPHFWRCSDARSAEGKWLPRVNPHILLFRRPFHYLQHFERRQGQSPPKCGKLSEFSTLRKILFDNGTVYEGFIIFAPAPVPEPSPSLPQVHSQHSDSHAVAPFPETAVLDADLTDLLTCPSAASSSMLFRTIVRISPVPTARFE